MNIRLTSGIALLGLWLAACSSPHTSDAESHAHDPAHATQEAHAEPALGVHGGRLLQQAAYGVELKLVENAAPARFQAWLYRAGDALPPSDGSVTIQLTRLGGGVEQQALVAQSDGSLLASSGTAEPHSFDVEVTAKVQGHALHWAYESHEGRTRIAREIAMQAGIRTAVAGPGSIADMHEVQGLVTPLEGRTARATARFPGPIRQLKAKVGDRVRAGQTLAVIESNLSLTPYPITAPIDGVVMSRDALVGDVASEGKPLFEIADLSSLWVDLHIFGNDAEHIPPGARVEITRLSDAASAQSVIERILPGTATASQSTIARARLANADGRWRPGAAVRARITVDEQAASLVVPLSAVQDYRGGSAVFVCVDDTYEARPVELGKRDARSVEILSGLQAGDQVVVEQSYLIKADLEKSGAAHEH